LENRKYDFGKRKARLVGVKFRRFYGGGEFLLYTLLGTVSLLIAGYEFFFLNFGKHGK